MTYENSTNTRRFRSLMGPIAATALLAAAAAGVAPFASSPVQADAVQVVERSWGGFEPPAGWLPPAIHPAGVQLQTKQLSPGVYALLSNQPPVDNSGFVVGERGVLVIDAHINGEMARQIQAAVRAVTDKPILYLVNTNYHGDHTFGNHAFPAATTVIAHRETAAAMADFEDEKQNLLPAVDGDTSVFAGVKLRLPDLTFQDALTIDLGGRVVQLRHFGHGNTPGDTVVYVPEAKVAWTGNLLLGAGSIPWAIEGKAEAYLQTITRLSAALDIDTIVPGHVMMATGNDLGTYIRYLGEHIAAVRQAVADGRSLEQTLAGLPLSESFLPSADSPLAGVRPFMQGFHRWNVKKTYLELSGQ